MSQKPKKFELKWQEKNITFWKSTITADSKEEAILKLQEGDEEVYSDDIELVDSQCIESEINVEATEIEE